MNLAPEIAAAIIAGGVVFGDRLLANFLAKRKVKPDLSDESYSELLMPILDDIKTELGTYRLAYWAAQNGEKTLDGYSIKKLSMVAECNSEDADDTIHEMQNVPSVAFKRNMIKLKAADSYIYSKEHTFDDQLGKLHRSFGIQTAYFFKCNNLKKKMWTGILAVAFKDKNFELDDTQLGWLQFQVNKIEGIISQL